MTERQKLAYESMGLVQRAAVDRMRQRVATPEARSEAARVRDLVEAEIPPQTLSVGSTALTALRGSESGGG